MSNHDKIEEIKLLLEQQVDHPPARGRFTHEVMAFLTYFTAIILGMLVIANLSVIGGWLAVSLVANIILGAIFLRAVAIKKREES